MRKRDNGRPVRDRNSLPTKAPGKEPARGENAEAVEDFQRPGRHPETFRAARTITTVKSAPAIAAGRTLESEPVSSRVMDGLIEPGSSFPGRGQTRLTTAAPIQSHQIRTNSPDRVRNRRGLDERRRGSHSAGKRHRHGAIAAKNLVAREAWSRISADLCQRVTSSSHAHPWSCPPAICCRPTGCAVRRNSAAAAL